MVYDSVFKRLCEITCSKFGCGLPDAEDAIQDACLGVLLEKGVLPEKRFLHLIIARIRPPDGKRVLVDLESVGHLIEESPESAYIERDLLKALIMAADTLPLAQKRTLYYRYIENKTPGEIAKLLNQPSGSVRKRLHVSKTLLKESLLKAGYDDMLP